MLTNCVVVHDVNIPYLLGSTALKVDHDLLSTNRTPQNEQVTRSTLQGEVIGDSLCATRSKVELLACIGRGVKVVELAVTERCFTGLRPSINFTVPVPELKVPFLVQFPPALMVPVVADKRPVNNKIVRNHQGCVIDT